MPDNGLCLKTPSMEVFYSNWKQPTRPDHLDVGLRWHDTAFPDMSPRPKHGIGSRPRLVCAFQKTRRAPLPPIKKRRKAKKPTFSDRKRRKLPQPHRF